MSYRVEIKPAALDEIARLPKSDQRRVATRIDALADDPRPPGCVKLAGISNLAHPRGQLSHHLRG